MPSRTTLRTCLQELADIGVVNPRRQSSFPGSTDYELTSTGKELLAVADILEMWLRAAPGGQVELGTPEAKNLVKALVDGWRSSMIRALAARSLSLNELNSLITSLNYPSVERRLRAMRLVGLVEADPNSSQNTLYRPTFWLRLAIAPLAAAARWERAQAARQFPLIAALDVEAAFLLVVPTLKLPEGIGGDCRLAVELGSRGGQASLAGVLVQVRDGQVVSCVARLQGEAKAWACGSPAAWLATVIEQDPRQLEVGGDSRFAHALLDDLHHVLYRAAANSSQTQAHPCSPLSD